MKDIIYQVHAIEQGRQYSIWPNEERRRKWEVYREHSSLGSILVGSDPLPAHSVHGRGERPADLS